MICKKATTLQLPLGCQTMLAVNSPIYIWGGWEHFSCHRSYVLPLLGTISFLSYTFLLPHRALNIASNGRIEASCCCGHPPNALFTLHCLCWAQTVAQCEKSLGQGPCPVPQEALRTLFPSLQIPMRKQENHLLTSPKTRGIHFNSLSVCFLWGALWAAVVPK